MAPKEPKITVTLRIEPELCGPVSIGTVAIIKLLQRHLQLGLDEAAACVERCVWDDESVVIAAPSSAAAARLVAAVAALPAVPRVSLGVR